MPQIDKILDFMVKNGGSDLHLCVGTPPHIRVDGELQKMNMPALTGEQVKSLLYEVLPKANREELEARWDTDFSYEISGLARFRGNSFIDRKGMGLAFRTIPSRIMTCDELGLSQEVRNLCLLPKGLVIITGPTGSGKTTTLATLVNECNQRRKDHVITIEDPIEFVHENKSCLINQREVHRHTKSFAFALRAALREDPDIILIGEMRDLETVAISLETAETGHLVFGTLHTNTAASTVDRIIDQFPVDQQQQVRVMLSMNLKAVIAQTLLKRKGGGRIAAMEVLIVNSAVANLIREGKTYNIPSHMETGRRYGNIPLNDVLVAYIQRGLVEPTEAYLKAVDKVSFSSKVNPVLVSMVKANQLPPLDALTATSDRNGLFVALANAGVPRKQLEQLRQLADQQSPTEAEG
jgi:twitching motility protein PilT